MASYDFKAIDLATVQEQGELVAPGKAVDSLAVTYLPTGQLLELKFGTGPWVTVRGAVPFQLCPPETEGVYYRVAAAGAGEAEVLASFAGVRAGEF